MTLRIEQSDPRLSPGRDLLLASQALMQSLYPPEHNFYLSLDELAADHIAFFVATLNDEGMGCVALAHQGDYGELKSLFVSPAARGAGVGAALMEQIEAQSRAVGLGLLRLETGDTLDAAHRLYARHGFTLCGPFGDYVEGPHSVFMEKRLAG